MTNYKIEKISSNEFIASRDDSAFKFVIKKNSSTWQIHLFPYDFVIDSDQSKTFLVNKIQNGGYDDYLIESTKINESEFPVFHRNILWDQKNNVEKMAPLNAIHWWKKGHETEAYYKCDLHFGDIYAEGIGDTLEESFKSLSTQIDLILN